MIYCDQCGEPCNPEGEGEDFVQVMTETWPIWSDLLVQLPSGLVACCESCRDALLEAMRTAHDEAAS